MGKIKLIILREYLTRVKKKSFLIMTILGPILMGSLIFARVWLERTPQEIQKIQVIDESALFSGKIESTKNLSFYFSDKSLINAQKEFYKSDFNIILYIPENILNSQSLKLFYKKEPGLTTEDLVKNTFKNKMEDMKLLASGIDKQKLESVKTNINLTTSKIEESGAQKNSNSGMNAAIGFLGAALIYMFIFLYGAQVMRGVIEEKTSRIVEVIISSVKPFELMMGKIIGIAMVGLTQFLLWIVLTFAITTVVSKNLMKDKYDSSTVEQTFKSNTPISAQTEQLQGKADSSELSEMLSSINFPIILGAFLFYFLGGYLLYGALFAAIGAAVDSEADTQQFMLPITIPLILAFVMAQGVVTNPESSTAFWLSIIPFTSPVIMMVRIAFGVPYYEVILSMVCLILGFLGTTWLSAKIYRTGILMYGKKVSYKELWKWLFYKG